jgi:hypothetical protein
MHGGAGKRQTSNARRVVQPVKDRRRCGMAEEKLSGQSASMDLRVGNHVTLKAELRVTTAGLLAIGALVSGIILSVAPLVWSARRRSH